MLVCIACLKATSVPYVLTVSEATKTEKKKIMIVLKTILNEFKQIHKLIRNVVLHQLLLNSMQVDGTNERVN